MIYVVIVVIVVVQAIMGLFDSGYDGPPRSARLSTRDADAPLTKLIIGLRKEKDLVGLAAMVDGRRESRGFCGRRGAEEGERGVA